MVAVAAAKGGGGGGRIKRSLAERRLKLILKRLLDEGNLVVREGRRRTKGAKSKTSTSTNTGSTNTGTSTGTNTGTSTGTSSTTTTGTFKTINDHLKVCNRMTSLNINYFKKAVWDVYNFSRVHMLHVF